MGSDEKGVATTSKWQGFKDFLHNPVTGEIIGRTGKSWGKIE